MSVTETSMNFAKEHPEAFEAFIKANGPIFTNEESITTAWDIEWALTNFESSFIGQIGSERYIAEFTQILKEFPHDLDVFNYVDFDKMVTNLTPDYIIETFELEEVVNAIDNRWLFKL